MCTQHLGARLRVAAARAAPRAEKQLAPQFYLVQFTGFYKYLKLFLSHTCAQYPIRPESAIKITWCHATTRSFCRLLSAQEVSAPAVLLIHTCRKTLIINNRYIKIPSLQKAHKFTWVLLLNFRTHTAFAEPKKILSCDQLRDRKLMG